MNPTEQQQAILDAVADPASGHLTIPARAGCGKTTTIVKALGRMPEAKSRWGGVLVCAFNTVIAKELQGRVSRLGLRGVDVSTLHSAGNRIIRDLRPFDKGAPWQFAEDALREAFPKMGRPLSTLTSALVKLVSRAKLTLTRDPDALFEAGMEWGLFPDFDKIRLPRGVHLDEEILVALALNLVAAECNPQAPGWDQRPYGFDEMVALPTLAGLSTSSTYKAVVVDEAQDMNPAQHALAKLLLAPGGRMIVVGDDRQAIYGFMGADDHALANLTGELGAKTLPLNVTFRCPRAVVAAAAELVPDFTACDGAEEGEARLIGLDQISEHAEGGDFVISRTNAGVVRACLALLRDGIPAMIRGREIGRALVSRIEKMAKEAPRTNSIEVMLGRLGTWLSKEVQRRKKAGVSPASCQDEVAAIQALCEGKSTVGEVTDAIKKLFDDRSPSDFVICMTTHKAKGLEAGTVFVDAESYAQASHPNLDYVAVTRAKERLFFCGKADGHMAPLIKASGALDKDKQPEPCPAPDSVKGAREASASTATAAGMALLTGVAFDPGLLAGLFG